MSTAWKIYDLLTPSERKRGLLLLGLMLIGMVLEAFSLGLIIPAITLFLEPDIAGSYPRFRVVVDALGNPTQTELVTGGLLTLVAVYLFKASFLAFLTWHQMRFAFGVQAQISRHLFDVYLRQPYTFHMHRNSAQLLRNVSTDLNLFTFTCMLPGLYVLTESLVLIGIAGLLFAVEPLGAMIVILVLGGSSWGFQRSTRALVARWGEVRQYHDGMRTQHLQQGLGGAREVKMSGREAHFLDRYSFHNTESARMGQLQQTMQALPRLWLELLAVAGLAALVLTMLAQGRDVAGIAPTLGLFAAAAFKMTPGVNRALSSLQALIYGLPVINTLYEEFKLDVPDARPEDSAAPIVLQTAIRLDDVSYTYPTAQTPALDSLSIIVRKGESIGVIGASGSGKSTLVDVVLGLLAPTAGRVTVNGQEIHHHLRSWQTGIGYVPQSVYLIDDTLRANIAFGLRDEQIDDTVVTRVVAAAQLEEFVADLPDGLNAMVGERGIRLSGGQRQRIGIARALYWDPDVLVLDEATSALDTDTERDVMQSILALRGKKTIMIVAHRFSTLEGCDRLYRLSGGRVAEEDGPSAVLQSRPAAPNTQV